jgi:hypothetical protein
MFTTWDTGGGGHPHKVTSGANGGSTVEIHKPNDPKHGSLRRFLPRWFTELGHGPERYGVVNRRSCGVALEGRFGQAYNEEAFRYLLEIERKRAERSGRPFLLLVVDLKEPSKASAPIEPVLAAKLFSRLWLCLRETDFIGWYRDGRVAGAVLPQLAKMPRPDVSRLVRERVTGLLCEGLPSDVVRGLHVRVYQLRPRLKG